MINLDVTQAAAPHGYYYAPDPSSQQICSIGGNVAENSGGAHCLKYGFTTNHVLGVEVVTPDGEVVPLGGTRARRARLRPARGVRRLRGHARHRHRGHGAAGPRCRRTCRTLLAGFASTDEAGAATSAIIAAGVLPAAIEMMDALAIEAAEAAVRCGYPTGAGAVLVVELDGPAAEVEHEFDAGGAALPRRRRVRDPGRDATPPSGR